MSVFHFLPFFIYFKNFSVSNTVSLPLFRSVVPFLVIYVVSPCVILLKLVLRILFDADGSCKYLIFETYFYIFRH